ncbi:MAG: hypothetical protein IJW86_06680 [Clostridia bacterium]|nr:hypothetical protein [Clostridia bacterium]
MLLLEEKFTVYPKNEKTNMSFPFEVAEEAKALKFTFSYSPKVLTDNERAKRLIEENIKNDAGEYADEYPSWQEFLPLKNLITLSVDDPFTYRGCAHRQAEHMEHIISESFASPGFNKGKVQSGQWKAVLNLHGIVTEKVDCHLKIEAGDFLE